MLGLYKVQKGTLTSESLEKIIDRLNELERDYKLYFEAVKKDYDKNTYIQILNKSLEITTNLGGANFAIKEISNYMDKTSLSVLLDFILLKDSSFYTHGLEGYDFTNTKVLCIKTIAKYRDTSTVTPLLYCLNNKNENYKIRLAIADALGKIGDKNAVDSLINVVKDEEEKSVYVRESAAIALGMIGDMRAIEPFLGILEAKKNFISKFTFLRERIIEALSKINFSVNDRIITALEDALMDSSAQVRLNALETISNSNCTKLFNAVKELLHDEDGEVAKNAVITLYNLSDRRILDEIIEDEHMPYYCKDIAREIIEEYEEDEQD